MVPGMEVELQEQDEVGGSCVFWQGSKMGPWCWSQCSCLWPAPQDISAPTAGPSPDLRQMSGCGQISVPSSFTRGWVGFSGGHVRCPRGTDTSSPDSQGPATRGRPQAGRPARRSAWGHLGWLCRLSRPLQGVGTVVVRVCVGAAVSSRAGRCVTLSRLLAWPEP